jgi:hypothetical protein
MSDFDTVLERLLDDPQFQRALAANPGAALQGYRLSDEERALLHAQVSQGAGGNETVETRTSKSGIVGLLAPLAGAVGMAAAAQQTFGQSGQSMEAVGQAMPLGQAQGLESVGAAGQASIGAAAQQGTEGIGQAGGFGLAPHQATGVEGLGAAPSTGHESLGAAPSTAESGQAGLGTAPGGADDQGGLGRAPSEVADYHTHVDVDGDGHWDQYTAYTGADGGVDIMVDMNDDGVVDFVGHDANGDGILESADYDNNLDGHLDTRMYDDDGDGWMDRTVDIG